MLCAVGHLVDAYFAEFDVWFGDFLPRLEYLRR